MLAAEGVIVDKMMKPGKDLPDEQVRFALDPSRNWAEFNGPGAVAPAAAKGDADKGETPKSIELVLTKRSALTTFARTPEGQAVADEANPAAPSESNGRVSTSPAAKRRSRVVSPTNFTVLKPGQFVAVQYRKAGDVNEVVALSVINRPSRVAPATGTAPASPARAARPRVRGRIPATPTPPQPPAASPASRPSRKGSAERLPPAGVESSFRKS